MNIENREKMLADSISALNLVFPMLKEKGISDDTFLSIRSILEICIKYGFDRGAIYGLHKGQMLVCTKISELMGNTDNAQ